MSSNTPSIPAVSINANSKSNNFAFDYCLSWGNPLMLETIAFFLPTIRLKKVDFPTFGLPTIAILNIFYLQLLFNYIEKFSREKIKKLFYL